jgi:hypothetical protein
VNEIAMIGRMDTPAKEESAQMYRPAPRDKSPDQLLGVFARDIEAEPARSSSGGPTAWAKAIVRVAILVGFIFVVVACKEAYAGPPFASNSTDQAGIVRLVGVSGQVDLVIPPHSTVMIDPPTTIGVVTDYWLFFDYCSTGVHSFSGPEPWQQGTSFAFLESGDNGSATRVAFGDLGSPPPNASAVAATTTCQDVATP